MAFVTVCAVIPGLGVALASPSVGATTSPETTTVALTPPAASPGVPEHRRALVLPAVEAELSAFEELATVRRDEALPATCQSPTCFREAAGAQASYVMRTELTAKAEDLDVRLSLIDVETGNTVASAAGACEVCTDVEVGEMVARTAQRLREPLDALGVEPSVLVVEGLPTQASVSLDGEEVGVTPLNLEVALGRHQLVVSAPDYASYTSAWVAEAGETHVEAYELRRLEAKRERRPLAIAGWSSLALGLASVGAGSALLVLHDRPVQSSCPGGVTDINGRCPRMYDTRVAGIATVAGGAALTVAAAALLGIDVKRRKADLAVGPRQVTLRLRF